MSVPALWPSALPLCANLFGQSGEMQDQVHRFTPEQGLPIQRAMQTAPVARFSLRFSGLSAAQMDAFFTFYTDTLSLGALPFAWVHPRRNVPREVRFYAPPSETRLASNAWSLAVEVSFLDTVPGWVNDVTVVNGYMELA